MKTVREKLIEIMEESNSDYWHNAPPDGWGAYGVWDHVTDAVLSYLTDDEYRDEIIKFLGVLK